MGRGQVGMSNVCTCVCYVVPLLEFSQVGTTSTSSKHRPTPGTTTKVPTTAVTIE